MDLFLKLSISGQFLMAGRFGENDMSFEGKFYLEIGNLGCARGLILAYDHTQTD